MSTMNDTALFQEIRELEGKLSACVIERLRSQSTTYAEYLEKLRQEYQALCDAIDNLANEFR